MRGCRSLGAEDHRMDVAAWLQSLGLERYVSAFRDNDVDAEVLPELTADDLIGLGVTSIGHRRKLLAAIAALRAEAPTPTATPAPRDAPAPADAERRQLTVMFCDLVGSTALSARLDPEDLREVIGAYHRAVAETVGGFDGFVAKYMGDGVLVYFGYPRAHEDDAERAVRAGLGVIDAVARLVVKSLTVHARVGIATGLVVVGDLIGEGSAQEQSVVGDAEPCRPTASPGRARCGGHRRGHAAAGRRSLRLPRSWHRRGQGPRRAGAGLAGAPPEFRGKPV